MKGLALAATHAQVRAVVAAYVQRRREVIAAFLKQLRELRATLAASDAFATHCCNAPALEHCRLEQASAQSAAVASTDRGALGARH